MLTRVSELLPTLCASSTEKAIQYTFPQACCLLFIFGVLVFLFSSND